MLDAAACGLPIIVNDTLLATERIDGNGITYRLNDSRDLAARILSLKEGGNGRAMGEVGARRMMESFSWASVAQRRLADFQAALESRGRAI